MKVALYTNPVTGGWSPRNLDALGGGEEAIVLWSEALTRAGHEVTVFYDGDPMIMRGVFYETRVRAEELAGQRYGTGFDVVVYRKTPQAAVLKLAPRAILWTDQVLPFDPRSFETIVVASRFLQRGLDAMLPSTRPRLHVIPDGYDPTIFDFENPPERNPNLVVYGSSPDRGLKELLQVWPEVKAKRPGARLVITYGWGLYERTGGDPKLRSECGALIAGWDEGNGWSVEEGRLSRVEFGRLLQSAGAWAYPCSQGEFFCQVAVKAQVAGCVPVVRPWGGLQETVWSGIKVDTTDEFTEALIRVLDPEVQEEHRALLSCSEYPPAARTWDALIPEWEEVLAGKVDKPDWTGKLLMVPETPLDLVPDAERSAIRALVESAYQGVYAVNAKRVYVDAALDFRFPARELVSTPRQADLVVLGYTVEDGVMTVNDYLEALDIPVNLPVLVLASYGTWRANRRRRNLTKRDLCDLFSTMPEWGIRVMPLDGDGNGISACMFRWDPKKLGARNPVRLAKIIPARQTCSVCMIARNVEDEILTGLHSVESFADEVVLTDNGPSTDRTLDVAREWSRKAGIPLIITEGMSPRWCFDCRAEHPIGELRYGHRMAGFETPRNQGLAYARGDWIFWLDCDEEICNPRGIAKYLRDNIFNAYTLQQHHHSVEPPNQTKIDMPARLFRRVPDGQSAGWVDVDTWPSYHPGLTARFTGVIHEHPGLAPDYLNGIIPQIALSDVWISHRGYLTETVRKLRFIRNWPLMAADRKKYPNRRLNDFLWLRDLTHHLKHGAERNQGMLGPAGVNFADAAIDIYDQQFVDSADPYQHEALGYGSFAMAVLRKGYEFTIRFSAQKPEVGGDKIEFELAGRALDHNQLVRLLKAKTQGVTRWEGGHL